MRTIRGKNPKDRVFQFVIIVKPRMDEYLPGVKMISKNQIVLPIEARKTMRLYDRMSLWLLK